MRAVSVERFGIHKFLATSKWAMECKPFCRYNNAAQFAADQPAASCPWFRPRLCRLAEFAYIMGDDAAARQAKTFEGTQRATSHF